MELNTALRQGRPRPAHELAGDHRTHLVSHFEEQGAIVANALNAPPDDSVPVLQRDVLAAKMQAAVHPPKSVANIPARESFVSNADRREEIIQHRFSVDRRAGFGAKAGG